MADFKLGLEEEDIDTIFNSFDTNGDGLLE